MSADEQPRDLEKGEPKGSAQNRLAQQDAAGTKGWRPSVDNRLETRSGLKKRMLFSCKSARFQSGPEPGFSSRVRDDAPFESAHFEGLRPNDVS
jgi:hypothetical protein